MQFLFIFFLIIFNVLPNSVDTVATIALAEGSARQVVGGAAAPSLATCSAATFNQLKDCLRSREGKTPDWNIHSYYDG